MEKIKINDAVLIGKYSEVEDLELSAITHNTQDTTKLNGLLVYGYETKFAGGTNENYERYTKECLDEFIKRYFVDNKLNMPVTLQHRNDIDHLCGRVLIVEVNSVGFYFVAYIPKSLPNYGTILSLITEGILQGFSKEGWATDYEYKYTSDGDLDYIQINKMEILGVSLVTTPANGNPFESVKKTKIDDATKFVNNRKDEEKESKLKKLFH